MNDDFYPRFFSLCLPDTSFPSYLLKTCILGYFRPGVTAGKTAEMEVVAVPSLPKQSHLYTAADEVINSLLDLQLEKWGLPPFEDCKPQLL